MADIKLWEAKEIHRVTYVAENRVTAGIAISRRPASPPCVNKPAIWAGKKKITAENTRERIPLAVKHRFSMAVTLR